MKKTFNLGIEIFDGLVFGTIMHGVQYPVENRLILGDQINIIKAQSFVSVPGDAMTDMLWSDPTKNFGSEAAKDEFLYNDARQISYYYTYTVVCEFLKYNDLICVIRGHEAQDAGYRMYKQSKHSKFPALITIFSAPNYCGTYGNKAVVLCYEKGNLNLKVF